jgi:two-component system sensor histidine kinase PhoQ
VANKTNDIISALNKVYNDKNISVELQIEQGLAFYGDENDLIEVMGNLLDNAYKYAQNVVRLSGSNIKSKAGSQLQLTFEDDGCGVPLEKRERILERGVRLDSSGEGHGFGLSIVADIVNNYQGVLSIQSSSLGGALFNIIIPNR